MGLFKKIKFHSPSFHLHGDKYKVGSWAKVNLSPEGRLSWKSGWRQHKHGYVQPDDDYRSDSVVGLLHPSNSARSMVFRNTARSAYG